MWSYLSRAGLVWVCVWNVCVCFYCDDTQIPSLFLSERSKLCGFVVSRDVVISNCICCHEVAPCCVLDCVFMLCCRGLGGIPVWAACLPWEFVMESMESEVFICATFCIFGSFGVENVFFFSFWLWKLIFLMTEHDKHWAAELENQSEALLDWMLDWAGTNWSKLENLFCPAVLDWRTRRVSQFSFRSLSLLKNSKTQKLKNSPTNVWQWRRKKTTSQREN